MNPVKYWRYLLLCIVFCNSIWSLHAQSSTGTSFWFSFMEHRDVGVNNKVVMITAETNTSGEVEIPFYNWSQSFAVQANQVTIIELPAFTENEGSNVISDKGILVSTQDEVSVYVHQYYGFRSEATLVLPETAIGQEYFVMSYKGVLRNGQLFPSEFLVVATQDETLLEITPSADTQGGGTAGNTFQIILNAGETFQLQAISQSGDLTGSHIIGDKDFAVFGGNSWTEVSCGLRDNLLEQMFPVDTWGKKVVTAPSMFTTFDLFRVQAAQNNTTVQVYDQGSTNPQSFTINEGEYIEYPKSVPTYIEADKPIQVVQYLVGSDCNGHNLGDPSMVLLNSVEQTRETVTLYNSPFQNISQHFINVIVSTDNLPFIELDGGDIPASAIINSVGLNDEFTVIQMQVGPGSHTITSSLCGLIATAYGYGEVESYAYSGGASFSPINGDPIADGACLNDSVYFDTGLPEERYSFEWDVGDGNIYTDGAFAYFFPALGAYPVELIITDECLGTSDTLNKEVLITLRQDLSAEGDTTVCVGSTVLMGATDLSGAVFEWTGPADYFSEEQYPLLYNVQAEMAGIYEVIGIISGCATYPEEVELVVRTNPTPNLGSDTVFCANNGSLMLNPGIYSEYLWQDGSTQPSIWINEGGTFLVEVIDAFSCVGLDSIQVQEICPTQYYVPNIFSPDFDGINDVFKVYAQDMIALEFKVLDRWGGVLFETDNLEYGWDGQVNGRAAESGVYLWELSFTGYRSDGEVYSDVEVGTVALVR